MRAFGAGRNCRELDQLLKASRDQAGPHGPIKAEAIRGAIMALHGADAARNLTAKKMAA